MSENPFQTYTSREAEILKTQKETPKTQKMHVLDATRSLLTGENPIES